MIGCIPETIPVKPGNPDGSADSIKSVEDTKEIIGTAKKNSRKSTRAKKTDETK